MRDSNEERILCRETDASPAGTRRLRLHVVSRSCAGQTACAGTLDAASETPRRVDALTIEAGIPGGGGEIPAGEGSRWATSFEYPITRIDPAINKVAQQFYGAGGDSIRAGRGWIWLTDIRAGTVWRIDPKRVAATLSE
jgi:hypothetical protein